MPINRKKRKMKLHLIKRLNIRKGFINIENLLTLYFGGFFKL